MENVPCRWDIWKSVLSEMSIYRSVISLQYVSVSGLNEWGLSLDNSLKEHEKMRVTSLTQYFPVYKLLYVLVLVKRQFGSLLASLSFSVRYLVAEYWIILIDSLKPNDPMALEAGSVVVVLKEESRVQEKQFLDKFMASVEVNENITTESIQHSIYYLPVWLCLRCMVVPTLCSLDPLLCVESICSLCGKEILGCAIYFEEIHAQGQRELQQTPVDVGSRQLGGQHWVQLQKACPGQTVLEDI